MAQTHYDTIVVGSGTCGATLSRELARRDKKVLVLEKGTDVPLRESLSGFSAVARDIPVGDKLRATTGVTAGGSTSLYLSVCKLPTRQTFDKLGLDLSGELEAVKRELPIAELPDEYLPPQSIIVRDSAGKLGYSMKKNPMLIDQSQCAPGRYDYRAKWKAKTFLQEAVSCGAELRTKAEVRRILVENGSAVGVEYRNGQGKGKNGAIKVYADKIVISAGALATPRLLLDSGIKGIGEQGFFCKPVFMVSGILPKLRGGDAYLGNLDLDLGDGISIGDGTMNADLFKLVMLSNFKLRYLFSHAKTLSVGILLKDSIGGEIRADGSYHKRLTDEERTKLKRAEAIAVKILETAGVKKSFKTRLVAGIPGGVIRIGKHVDENMQTEIPRLYVCDHTLINDVDITPTLTLICLARRLSGHLLAST